MTSPPLAGDSGTSSMAEQLVRELSSRISIDDMTVNLICDNMQHHCIREEWQVSSLDSLEWQQLGAPIGLAVAIRKLSLPIVDDSRNVTTANVSFPSVIPCPSTRPDNASMGASSGSFDVRVRNSSIILQALMLSGRRESTEAINNGVHEVVDEEDPTTRVSRSDRGRPICLQTFFQTDRQYSKLPGNTSTILKVFQSSQQFHLALLLTKTGQELKAYTVFWLELAIVSSALFLGAAAQIWSTFPLDRVNDGYLFQPESKPYIAQTYAIVFHFLAGSSVIVHIFLTIGWIWIICITAAVSANKFHIFLVQTRWIFAYFLAFSEVGITLLSSTTCFLMCAMVAGTSDDPTIVQICCSFAIVFSMMAVCILRLFTSYIGRLAFHGLLLMDDDPERLKQERQDGHYIASEGGGVGSVEALLTAAFQKHHVFSEAQALDYYYQSAGTTMASSAKSDWDFPSLLDVLFPKSQKSIQPATVLDDDVESAKTK